MTRHTSRTDGVSEPEETLALRREPLRRFGDEVLPVSRSLLLTILLLVRGLVPRLFTGGEVVVESVCSVFELPFGLRTSGESSFNLADIVAVILFPVEY